MAMAGAGGLALGAGTAFAVEHAGTFFAFFFLLAGPIFLGGNLGGLGFPYNSYEPYINPIYTLNGVRVAVRRGGGCL